jgi:DNA invertase Pin-like site-specific DNA recombinase
MNQILGYARVSTADQNPDLQVDELNAAGCHRIFVEHATGAQAERPQLGQALDHLRSGDTLVVWRLDRLARSLRDLINLVTTLEERGVGFRSLHERVDTTSPGGRLVFHLFGALAEFERDLIRERSLAGLAAARARGRNGGRPSVMTPAKIARARELYEERDLTVAEIAKTLGVSRASVYRHLPSSEASRPEVSSAD